MNGKGIWETLLPCTEAAADRPALTDPHEGYITYRELRQRVESIAHEIRRRTQNGAIVGVLTAQPFHGAIGILAALAAGRVALPLTLHYGEERCQAILQRARPSLVITDSECDAGFLVEEVGGWGGDILYADHQRDDIPPLVGLPEVPSRAPAVLLFTSGTTGASKGVMLSHENVCANIEGIGNYFSLQPSDHIVIVRSLSHASALTGELIFGLSRGLRISFFREAFSPRVLFAFLNRVSGTVCCATPTMAYHLATSLPAGRETSLRRVALSGECLLPRVRERLLDRFPQVEFYNVYGLTEAAPRVSYLAPEWFATKPGAVGLPLSNVQVKVVDPKGNELDSEGIGEIWVKGPNVMMGYWEDPVATADRLCQGWLRTGDLGHFDYDGFLYVVGRADDMIIRAGVNIYPSEIEDVLLTDPRVKEVLVWGEPDEHYGQRICAKVVGSQPGPITIEAILATCREKLPAFQWPDQVHIVDQIEWTVAGKMSRRSFQPFRQ